MANDIALEIAGKTDPGLVRSQNEDAILTGAAHGFVILADGMGGYNAGEVASSMAVAAVRDALEREFAPASDITGDTTAPTAMSVLVERAIQRANLSVYEAARSDPQYEGMGTTIVVAVFRDGKATIAHVGDSRMYRLRQGALQQITRDHSLLQEQIDAGLVHPSQARFSSVKNLVTRAVGVAAETEVEVHEHEMQPADLYLLCSDGLSDMLADEELLAILTAHHDTLDDACDDLVRQANARGGLDNISVILVRIPGDRPSGLLSRVLHWIS